MIKAIDLYIDSKLNYIIKERGDSFNKQLSIRFLAYVNNAILVHNLASK